MIAHLRPVALDGVEPGKRLVRIDGGRGASLAELLSHHIARLAWQTPLHRFRLRGRYPLKLLAVPQDPFAGDPLAGEALLGGSLYHRGEAVGAEGIDFAAIRGSPALADHLQSFAWLRDLAAAAPREEAAPVAEYLARRWLAAHAERVDDRGWRPDLWGLRILHWAAHAPLLLSSTDQVYRSAMLNTLARGARHLEQSGDRVAPGLPRVTAWAGVVAAGLLIPGGEARIARGEAALRRALHQALVDDGGAASRSPVDLVELIELLSLLCAVYEVRKIAPAPALLDALRRAVPALKGVALGDGALSSWQGGSPLSSARVEQAVAVSGVRARPLRNAPSWGYQRLVGARTVVVVDTAPPPSSRLLSGGRASTLAFEMSDGPHRMIVNCGGDRGATVCIAPALAQALRATAAHSTLVLADSNSTAVHGDGALGRGVTVVELVRREEEAGSFVEASHDGYARRFGFLHRRHLHVAVDGREVRGEDVLDPGGLNPRRRPRLPAGSVPVALRFHLAPAVEVALTDDARGAMLRVGIEKVWDFGCSDGRVTTEDSIWIDGDGVPRPTLQLVVETEASPGGGAIAWTFHRAN